MVKGKGNLLLNGNVVVSDIEFTYEVSDAGVNLKQCFGKFELEPAKGKHILPGNYELVRSDGKQCEIVIQHISHSSGDIEFEFQCNTPFE